MNLRKGTDKDPFLDGPWTVDDSAEVYGISSWGNGYFTVGAGGNVQARPNPEADAPIDMTEIIEELGRRGLHTPALIRFPQIVEHRLRELHSAFAAAIADNDYNGQYHCVYPIKVNQQRHVCAEVCDISDQLGFGLEAGSKPELLAVLGMTEGKAGMPIVCNGFKDDEFVETVILATKLGRNIIPIVENSYELRLLIKHARLYDVRPRLGIRVKLSSRGNGRWESSGGPRSKFGLSASQLLHAVELLRDYDLLDCLELVHCHVGSQVSDIRQLKKAVSELARYYVELRRLGANVNVIDVGGGLGVDYDGSQTTFNSSMNYTIEEYAADIVHRIRVACDEADAPHPAIYSESGRATVAYSSVLVCNVIGSSRFDQQPDVDVIRKKLAAATAGPESVPQPVLDLLDAYETVCDRNLHESYHDTLQARDEAASLFELGYLSLEMRGICEELFWAMGNRLLERASRSGGLPEEFGQLPELLSDIYFCNFSVFQSLPDSWAIQQLFPICPIHRLDERPSRRGTLVDVTCDSDGKVDQFVSRRDTKRTLELHPLTPGKPYLLGVFLLGAYQEILGDLHNLFGDTHAVHVSVDASGQWSIDEVIRGDRVRDVLGYLQYDHEELRAAMRRSVDGAIERGRLSAEDGASLLSFYDNGLDGYTYLEDEPGS
ncbi:MAG: biosynthetic arginine decarboxylase [Planctomycetota bacterium]